MSSLPDLARAAIAFEQNIRFLAPTPTVAALGPDVIEFARSRYGAHLAALAPHAAAPLPEARVEVVSGIPAVWRRIGLAVPGDPLPAMATTADPTTPTAPPSMMRTDGPSIVMPDAMHAWQKARDKAWSSAPEAMRRDPKTHDRLCELGTAMGVKSSQTDPYHHLAEVVREPLRVARWEHPGRGASEHVPAVIERPHEVASRMLEAHLHWVTAFGDSLASPWWPAIELWSLGLWSLVAPDGVLVLFAPTVHEGRVVFDEANPTAPWPKIGFRTSGMRHDRWESFDAYANLVTHAGFGPVPGEFSMLHGNPPGPSFGGGPGPGPGPR